MLIQNSFKRAVNFLRRKLSLSQETMKGHGAEDWIRILGLGRHPAGDMGYVKNVFTSGINVQCPSGSRHANSSIYFLQQCHQLTQLHRLQSSDELYFYHDASRPQSRLVVSYLDPEREAGKRIVRQVVGPDVEKGETLQAVIPAGHFQCSHLESLSGPVTPSDFTLFSVVVSPGFDIADSHPADRDALIKEFPECKQFIMKFT